MGFITDYEVVEYHHKILLMSHFEYNNKNPHLYRMKNVKEIQVREVLN